MRSLEWTERQDCHPVALVYKDALVGIGNVRIIDQGMVVLQQLLLIVCKAKPRGWRVIVSILTFETLDLA